MANDFDFSWMQGKAIAEVALNPPGQWSFSFGAGVGIGAECPWRLLKDGHVAVSSEDHAQKYGLPLPIDAAAVASELLASKAIVRVEVKQGTADLLLDFADGLRLEIIPFSSGYESWGATTPSGFQLVAQGGGQLSGWRHDA